MRVHVVAPERSLPRARALADLLGYDVAETTPAADGGVEMGLALGSRGGPILLAREGVRIPKVVRRVLVPHEGSPETNPGLQAADAGALMCGAEIVVLHVPSLQAPRGAGSLPAPRFTDHAHHDWAEWRREFERRFCRCSEGVDVRLEIALGPPAESIVSAARRLRADLVVLTWKGRLDSGRAATVRGVLNEATVPVLVVSEATGPGQEVRARTGKG